ncbi:MAG TPA: c-type cytochrome [Thermoanaerobaculia bacterium]|nr:c-type cytochrome [Thermoanaerobaculia bacterium]
MRAGLAIISLIVLAIHGVVFYNQFYAPWQDYQKQYFTRAAKASDNEAVQATLAARKPAIEQTIVKSFGPERIDRCRTCHIAADDPRFANADQPLRTHPQIPGHKFETFGCTICHDGQGRAVDARHAHEGGEDWPWPLLPTELIEANCVQCHSEPDWPHAPLVNEGRRLFFARACYTCHTISGLSYGSIGPELTEVGKKRRHDYIRHKIEDPRATNPTSTMPKQDLTGHQITALTAFLKAQQGAGISRAPLTQFVSKQQQRPEWLPVAQIVGREAAAIEALPPVERGKALLPQVGCLSCHKLEDQDGRVGPELAFTAVQRDHAWLMAHFRDPKSVVPGSLMPPYPLPEAAFDSLSLYLLSRTPPAIPTAPAEQYQLLCARCHGEKGQGDGVISPYLDPKPRDLTKAAFMKTKTRERLIASVRQGVPGTSMAPWGGVLDEAAAGALVDHVLADITQGSSAKRVERKVPQANPVPMSRESAARGEAIFLNRCWGCHGKKADGHGPNAEDIVPRPRNLRNTPFLRSVSYARLHESIQYGVQGTAMPAAGFDFALDEKSIGDLINYIYSLNGMGAPVENQVAQAQKER